MLREHLHRLVLGDALVQRVPEPLEERGELCGSRASVEDELADALDVPLGDLADVLRPVLPVDLSSALADEHGVHGLLQLLVGEVELHLLALAVELGRQRALAFAGCIRGLLAVLRHVDDVDDRCRGRVVFKPVDGSVEPLVVAAERLHDLPYDLEGVRVVERLLGRHARRYDDGKDDVAVLLALEAPHDAAHGLNHLDARLLGLEEHDGVEVGDVNALGEAVDVGEHVALAAVLVRVVDVGEPAQLLLAKAHVHGAVHVVDNALQQRHVVALLVLVVDVGVDRPLEVVGHALGLGDGGAESHGVLQAHALVALALVGEALPAPDDLRGVGDLEALLARHRHLVDVAHDVLGDRQRDDAVVGEKPLVHGAAEREAVEDRAELRLVVHGGDLVVLGLGLTARVVAIELGGRRHVDAAVRRHEPVVVDLSELALLLQVVRRLGRARGAVGLVGHDEIEGVETHALGVRDDLDRLVGREDHVDPAALVESPHLLVEVLGVGGGGIRDVG